MKLGIAFLAALAVVACGRIAGAGEIDQAVVVKVADQGVAAPAVRRYRHLHRYAAPPPPYPYPVACGAVLFPRSPLCANHPAPYGYYATFPWNSYWSY